VEHEKINWSVIFYIIIISLLIYMGGFATAAIRANRRIQSISEQYENRITETNRELGELRRVITEAEAGARRADERLGEAIATAERIQDRSKRIEVLLRGIIEAVHELRGFYQAGTD
jgi:hypothetical protein